MVKQTGHAWLCGSPQAQFWTRFTFPWWSAEQSRLFSKADGTRPVGSAPEETKRTGLSDWEAVDLRWLPWVSVGYTANSELTASHNPGLILIIHPPSWSSATHWFLKGSGCSRPSLRSPSWNGGVRKQVLGQIGHEGGAWVGGISICIGGLARERALLPTHPPTGTLVCCHLGLIPPGLALWKLGFLFTVGVFIVVWTKCMALFLWKPLKHMTNTSLYTLIKLSISFI